MDILINACHDYDLLRKHGNDNKGCICYNETIVCYSNKTLTLMQELQLLTEHSLDLFEIILVFRYFFF